MMQSHSRPSPRLFEKDWMEWFTHVHPITPLLIWAPFVSYMLWRSFSADHLSVAAVGALGFLGLFVWTLTEYLLHRFVFHFKGETAFSAKIYRLIHGVHHEDPEDATRLVMPPFAGIAIGIGMYSTFRLILGPVWVDPFFAFFIVGYLVYDYTHFAVHHFRPRTPLGRFIKQHHMHHHFVCPEACWGVSTPLWDYVFGTLEERKPAEPRGSRA